MTIKIRFSVQLGLRKSELSPLAARPCHNVSLAKIWYCRNVVAEKILCIYCVIYPLFYTKKYLSSRGGLIYIIHHVLRGYRVMVLNATFNNISVISWWSVLLEEETRIPRENH